jgi:hypothetical protein
MVVTCMICVTYHDRLVKPVTVHVTIHDNIYNTITYIYIYTHTHTHIYIYKIICFFMLFCVLFVCKCVLYCTVLLPPGVNPTAVNKYTRAIQKVTCFGVARRGAALAPPSWCQSVPSLNTHPAVVACGLCCFCFVHREFLKCVLQ